MSQKKEKSKDVHILNVRVSAEITNWLDEVLSSKMYNSRSEAIRDFLRDYLKKHLADNMIDGDVCE